MYIELQFATIAKRWLVMKCAILAFITLNTSITSFCTYLRKVVLSSQITFIS